MTGKEEREEVGESGQRRGKEESSLPAFYVVVFLSLVFLNVSAPQFTFFLQHRKQLKIIKKSNKKKPITRCP